MKRTTTWSLILVLSLLQSMLMSALFGPLGLLLSIAIGFTLGWYSNKIADYFEAI